MSAVTRAFPDIHDPEDEASDPFTDDRLANVFAGRHHNELRYVAPWGRWMRWEGHVWRPDSTLAVFDLARAVAREAAATTEKPHHAVRLASAQTVAAIERLARSDRRVSVDPEVWDQDDWALNTPAGVGNLQTGELRPHRRADHFTKSTSVGPGGDCPTWERSIERWAAGDRELVAFLQRTSGYLLTGSTREHAIFFIYGLGANGKSTMLNALSEILGDYATVASFETFTVGTGEHHPTDLAALRGARLVSAGEVEDGRRWAEARLKAMSGGDPLTARFMRGDFFTYRRRRRVRDPRDGGLGSQG